MYEKFTERARKVMQLANDESHRLAHEYIGTEHILLGLIKEGSGVAAKVLKNLDVDRRKIRLEIEKLVQSGPDMVTMGKLPRTPRAKKVIEYSMEEARNFNHDYVGTEHILLGLLREEEGVAAQVLMNLGLRINAVRQEILDYLKRFGRPPQSISGHESSFTSRVVEDVINVPRGINAGRGISSLVAIDVGNSQIKLGQFARDVGFADTAATDKSLPEPIATLELPTSRDNIIFDFKSLSTWCEKNLSLDTHWLLGSVHRSAGNALVNVINLWAKTLNANWPVRRLTYKDIPFPIRVDEPERVGIDRLLAAVAANHLRTPDRAAIVVDLGTAITVDLVEADGAFAGGAILPGIGMASRALADQTDALPHVVLEHSATPPSPLGKSTKSAIEAGLYWGTVGAVGEIASRLTARLPTQPDFFITGGAARTVADSIEEKSRVRYVPHLVLSGIALIAQQTSGRNPEATG